MGDAVSSRSMAEARSGPGPVASAERDRERFTAAAPVPVLFIEHSIGVSGSTVSLCTLLRRLERRRYDPCVVFSRGPAGTPARLGRARDRLAGHRVAQRFEIHTDR